MPQIKEVSKQWDYIGFKCEIRKIGFEYELPIFYSDMGLINEWYCGYVYVKKFPHDIEYELDCHGGITYNDESMIGFDCNHYGDEGITVQDIDYCTKQCELIVEQLIGMGFKDGKANFQQLS